MIHQDKITLEAQKTDECLKALEIKETQFEKLTQDFKKFKKKTAEDIKHSKF